MDIGMKRRAETVFTTSTPCWRRLFVCRCLSLLRFSLKVNFVNRKFPCWMGLEMWNVHSYLILLVKQKLSPWAWPVLLVLLGLGHVRSPHLLPVKCSVSWRCRRPLPTQVWRVSLLGLDRMRKKKNLYS